MPTKREVRNFWNKVSIIDETECWEWKASSLGGGYGSSWLNGKTEYAHRVSWIIHYGEIPEGMCICHTCDNRRCVNPNHLFLGTYSDNAIDREIKNRGVDNSGENHPTSKLTHREVKKFADYT